MDKIESCKLCFESFSETSRPRVMPCGHSYCTDCLERMVRNGTLQCPKCKANHKIVNAKHLPINYDLEETISDARKAHAFGLPKTQPCVKFTKIKMVIEEQKANVHNLNLAAEDMLTQLKDYDEFLLEKRKNHKSILDDLVDLCSWHEDIIREINEERQKVSKMQAEASDYNREVKQKLPNLDNAVSNKEAATAVAELVECFADLEGWIERCHEEFPRSKIASSQQILHESMETLSLLVTKKNEITLETLDLHAEDDFTILEKLAEFGSETLVTFDRLKQKPEHWRRQIASGQVFAVCNTSGRRRSAKLSWKDGKVYLHHLIDQDAPSGARKIQHSEILNAVNSESTVAFMDIQWDGYIKGRVHILLTANTPLGRHFKALCTGEKGPSYAKSKFYDVSYSDASNECIRGGDYEWNNGYGGAQVMSRLNKGDSVYDRKCETGIVYATPNTTECRGAQFSITTGYGRDTLTSNVFGKVQDGLGVMKSAAKQVNTKDVRIFDCGIVVPL